MAGKRHESLIGLVCPKCGRRMLGVYNTMGFDSCVIRQRKCVACGYKTQTLEVPMDLDVVMRSAIQIIIDNAKGNLRLPEPELQRPMAGIDA